jgi:hypothetical protein
MRNGTNQQAGLGFVFLVRFFNALLLLLLLLTHTPARATP